MDTMENTTTNTIDLSKLSTEQRKAFKAELAEQDKAEKQKRKADLATLKALSADYVDVYVDRLVSHRDETEHIIDVLFKDATRLVDLKEVLYGVKVKDQESHTFTLADGSASLTIGYNVNIGFDGTESAGIEKIKSFLVSLATDDEKNVKLTKAVHRLLKPKAKTGQFNPSSIIELSNMREDFNDPLFDEGLDIIIAAQQKRKNSMFVSGWKFVVDGEGRSRKVEFRFSI